MAQAKLSGDAARRRMASVEAQLGKADRDRLTALLALIGPDGRINLAAALDRLFPDQRDHDSRLAQFRQLRGRLKAAVEDAQALPLALEADGQTRTAPEQRFCWFSGDDAAAAAAARRSEEETPTGPRSSQDAIEVGGRRIVRYFISYARKGNERKLRDALMERLGPLLKINKTYDFRPWRDDDIILGKNWHQDIQAAIKACDFGLLLVSPNFLASDYIPLHELRQFVPADPFQPEAGKLAAPVALVPLPDSGTSDHKGLQHRQIFYDRDGKAFQQRTTDQTKQKFAQELYDKIVAMLDHGLPEPPSHDTQLRRHADNVLDRLACFVNSSGQAGTLAKGEDAPQADERQDALAFLMDWATDSGPQAQPCCVLLGEYGMGKTTTSAELTRRLLEARKADPSQPLPIYLDLRLLGEQAKSAPDLLAILDAVLRRSWHAGRTDAALTAAELVRLVQHEGALVIFDGLDEVLVHLSDAAGRQFVRELYRILPPALWPRQRKPGAPGRPGKVMMTCRTHYFRTLRDQSTFLTAEGRDGIGAGDYRVFVLLPFTEAQIESYLRQALPDTDTARVLETIGAVHNLKEMAERPYTLGLIAHHFERIERWRMEGRTVTGVDLYREMVRSWLERDAGKHQLTPDHKQDLMEQFAAALWRSGQRSWSVRELEDWLIGFLRQHPVIADHYHTKDRELLKEDLRTATFLVWEGADDDRFRFAHSSLQEFFLAGFLFRALAAGRPEDWALPKASPETLDFLGQMLTVANETERANALATLRALRDAYRPQASEQSFAYLLRAQAKGYPAPSPAGIRLEGADLRGWTIAAAETRPPLALTGARFDGARLNNAVFRRVDLSHARFDGANLFRAELTHGRATAARFDGANLTGTLFRALDLTDADFTAATAAGTNFLRCTLTRTQGLTARPPDAFFALCSPGPDTPPNPWPDGRAPRLAVLTGHSGGVLACAFSPDGSRIVSAGWDSTVRLWRVDSAEPVAVLTGHVGRVRSCAFSPDGSRIASAGDDGTLRLWREGSAEPIAVLTGHEDRVWACVFSPDGSRILSAGDDGTLRLWREGSAEPVAVLTGHQGAVWACTFSPDDSRILSAGKDGTLRLWQADRAEPVVLMTGHQGGVLSCAFSPDGSRILSAGADDTLRLWREGSAEPVAVMTGHRGEIWGCAFSPDGSRIASAGDDGTLRLWRAEDGEAGAVSTGHQGPIWGCAFSPDGSRILSAGNDGSLRLWRADSAKPVAVMKGHRDWLRTCAFSPDGSRLLAADSDGRVRLWHQGSAEPVAVLTGHQGLVSACAFSPDGSRIASAGSDGTLHLWREGSAEPVAVLTRHQGWVNACAFSPDGHHIASAGNDGTLRLWREGSAEPVAVLTGHERWINACAFSPDGRTIASAGNDGTLRLWRLGGTKPVAEMRGHDGAVLACAFSPDGHLIVSAGNDGRLLLWRLGSAQPVAVMAGHEGSVNACAFSPDGHTIASAGKDGTLRLWDAEGTETIAVMRGHRDDVYACAFSPDGSRLLSAGDDGTLRQWDVARGVETGFRIEMLPEGAWVAFDVASGALLHAGGEAWRWLGWQGPEPGSGRMTRYPAESFGALPGVS